MANIQSVQEMVVVGVAQVEILAVGVVVPMVASLVVVGGHQRNLLYLLYQDPSTSLPSVRHPGNETSCPPL